MKLNILLISFLLNPFPEALLRRVRGPVVEDRLQQPVGDPQRRPLVDGVGGRLLCRHARHEGGHVGRAHQEKSWGGNSIENKFQLEFQLEKSLRVLA